MLNPPAPKGKQAQKKVMMLIYNKSRKENSMEPKAPKKWFPTLKRRVLMQEHEVAQELSDEVTLSPMKARTALCLLQKVMVKALSAGRTVQPDGLDMSQRILHAEGTGSLSQVGHIENKKINLRFRTAPKLKESPAKVNLPTTAD